MIDFTRFRRPQRYIGNEWNVIKKPHYKKLKVCMCYPDIYEIGMSNLGLRIIYGLLNECPDVVCERVFMPGLDFFEFLNRSKTKLFSLETKTDLDKFDILGFHLGCELNFTNFLHILKLGNIAIWSKDRKKTIVVGGGVANPEPLADFIDVFYLGEFEAIVDKFVEILGSCSRKDEKLKAFSKIEGFYVPSLQSLSQVKRVYTKDLNSCFYPANWLTPHTAITHDRVPVEISRGCPNKCTFCQAQGLYRPYRERSIDKIMEIMDKIYKASGYESVSLLSLSASDYSKIEGLVTHAYDYCKSRRINLSLPSLRIDDMIGPLYEKLNLLSKTSLTLAVEAPRDCLRSKLNKKIDINKLFEAARILKSLKAKNMKLYFMFGFEDETDEDLLAIGKFVKELRRQSGITPNISINIFIPKPLSLWEGKKMADEDEIERKRKIIISNIPGSVRFSISSTKNSIIEGRIAKGDRNFAKVIYRAFEKGAKFDAYKEHFDYRFWEA